MRVIFLMGLLLPTLVLSANWSRYITTQNHDDISISFRQMKKNNAWLVEWQVNNNSNNTVEPFLKTRNYLCEDKNILSFKETSLGIYLPKTKRSSYLKDYDICPRSKIKWVEIETEILDTVSRDKQND